MTKSKAVYFWEYLKTKQKCTIIAIIIKRGDFKKAEKYEDIS